MYIKRYSMSEKCGQNTTPLKLLTKHGVVTVRKYYMSTCELVMFGGVRMGEEIYFFGLL